jgi:hypothetical protein
VCTEIETTNKIYFCQYGTDFISLYNRTLAQISRRDNSRTQFVSYEFCTVPYSPFLADKLRQNAMRVFWKVWHGFQGDRTTINALRNLLKQLAHISRHPYNILEAHKSRSRPAIYCRKFSKEF